MKVGDLVRPLQGGDLDCEAFSGAVGLVVKSGSFEGDFTDEKVFELLVEWCGKGVSLWENPEHLEVINENW